MPELDVLHGFDYVVTRAQEQQLKKFGSPLRGYLQIWPRTFATGTDSKPWWTSCVIHNLDPEPGTPIGVQDPGYVAHLHDLRRCKGDKGAMWLPFTTQRLETGDICKFTRGKEFCIGAGKNLLKCHFGLEGCLVEVRRDQYERIVAQDSPGSNKSKSKANLMRSFIIPEDLTIPHARGKNVSQKIVIMAAIVCEHIAFLFVDFSRMIRLDIFRLDRDWTQDDLVANSAMWGLVWDEKHGPDWIVENAAAEEHLDEWRSAVLVNTDPGVEEGIVEVMCSKQEYFNGYGRHTAHDLLYHMHLWPGTPPSVICADDELYNHFKILLGTYARQFIESKYRERCLGEVNMATPFAFNYKSDNNYLGQFVKVYRKWQVNVPAVKYNEMYMDGLLDPEHTIGQPYAYDESKLLIPDRDFAQVDVDSYEVKSETWHTIIKARRPSAWKYGLNADQAEVPGDVRHAGMSTTLGNASFHPFKQNQFDPKVYAKRGRPKKHKTGNRGRPTIEPTAQKIKARAKRGEAGRKKAIIAAKRSQLPPQGQLLQRNDDLGISDDEMSGGADHGGTASCIETELMYPGRRITRGMAKRVV